LYFLACQSLKQHAQIETLDMEDRTTPDRLGLSRTGIDTADYLVYRYHSHLDGCINLWLYVRTIHGVDYRSGNGISFDLSEHG
jgi:hypothetical protein